jgi:hypothetical protein
VLSGTGGMVALLAVIVVLGIGGFIAMWLTDRRRAKEVGTDSDRQNVDEHLQ